MRRLTVFNSVSLDGYFCDAGGDMRWAHRDDPEWQAFTSENASGESTLVFGRVTYDLMAGFWPTPQARAALPSVAERMNSLPKVMFSRTLTEVSWQNTTLIRGDLEGAVRRMKLEPGPGMVILGSGSIVSQLTAARLIDEYQLALCPIVLGSGRTMFSGIPEPVTLVLRESRPFKNGTVVLRYELGGRPSARGQDPI